MNDDITHVVKIEISGKYPHGDYAHAVVSVAGDGGMAHMIDAFKAALVAAGFSMELAAKLEEALE